MIHPSLFENLSYWLQFNQWLKFTIFGLAEVMINDGEIKGFNVVNSGNSLSSTDAIFVDGKELDLQVGQSRGIKSLGLHLEKFCTDLNDLVSSFVEEINGLYNPTDVPGSYLLVLMQF